MKWPAWLLVALVALNAGWMLFDGARALVVGDYVTPRTGPYAGRLGPWAGVLEAVAIEPRSKPVKVFFVAYGASFLAASLAAAAGSAHGWRASLLLASLGLWYLPLGTVVNALVLLVLFRPEIRARVGLA